MSHWTSPKALGHDAAATLMWYRAVAAWDVLIMVHAQVVAQLMGHGGCYTNGVLGMIL